MYEITDAQTNKKMHQDCIRGTALERSVGKQLGAYTSFTRAKRHPKF